MPRTTARRTAFAAVLMAAVLALTSCGGGGEGEPDGPHLSFGVQAPPNSFDPAQLHDGAQRYVWGAVYDTLIYSDDNGDLRPAAAESWEYSDDARTLTLALRDDMTFDDGDPVTSGDVKATLERTRDTAGPQQSNLHAIESIDTPDEHTVVLNLSRPDPNLLVALAFGSGVIGDADTLDEEGTALAPVGSGPYVLDPEQTVDGSTYVLRRRDDHWNADSYPFETITVRAIQDRTALFNALLSGELDAGTADVAQAERIEEAGLSLTRIDGLSIGQLVIADRDGEVVPALADVRVRQAVNLALDRQAIVDSVLQGLGRPTGQVFNTASPAYVEDLDDRYGYDPDRALELLDEAGYGDGFTVAMPENLFVQPVQPTITQALGDIGVTVEWEPVPAQQSGQTTDWGMYFNLGGVAPPSRTLALYFGETGSQNPFGTTDPELDALYEELSMETDPEAAADIYREINTFAVEEAWFAPIYSQATNWATAEGVDYVGTSSSLFDIRVFDVSE